MSAGGRPALRAVKTTEELLAEIVPELIEAEAVRTRLHQLVLRLGRLLAHDRGVASIREEQIRKEFGGQE